MAGDGDSPVRRRRGCRRRLLIWLVLPLLAVALLIWWQRDLPRRTVERELAARLGARVRLGSLEIRGAHSFALNDLIVRDMGSAPWLASLRVRRVEVEGEVGEILAGRIDLLRLSGLEARLAPATREPADDSPASSINVERLLVEDARVRVEAGESAEFAIEADLRDVGAEMEGDLRVRSSGFPIAPLLALGGEGAPASPIRLERFEAGMSVGAGGREWTLDARSASTRVVAEPRELDLRGVEVRARAVRDDATGVIRIDAQPVLPAVAASTLWVEIDNDRTLLRGEAELSGIALAEALSLAPFLPGDARAEGLAGLRLRVPEPGVVRYDLDAAVDALELQRGGHRVGLQRAEFGLEGSVAPEDGYRGEAALRCSAARLDLSGAGIDLTSENVTVAGTARTAGAAAPVEVAAELHLPSLSGLLGDRQVPPAAVPLDLAVRGTATGSPSFGFDGEIRVRGPVLGRLQARGTVNEEDHAARLALDWTWDGAEADRLPELLGAIGVELDDRLSVRARLGGRGRLEGALTDPRIAGELRADELNVSLAGSPERALGDGRAAADFTWNAAEPRLAVRSAELEGLLRAQPLDPVRLRLTGEGTFSPRRGLARLQEALLELDGLGRVRLEGTWSADSDPPVLARVGLEEIDLATLRSHLNAMAGDPLPGYSLSGTLRSTFRLGWEPGGPWNGEGELLLGSPGLSSEDGSRVLQAMDTEVKVTANSPGSGAGIALDASAPLGGFLALWGAFFGDWSDRAGRCDLHVEIPPRAEGGAGGDRWSSSAILDLERGPRVRVELTAPEDDVVAYDLHAEVAEMGPVFDQWVRAPLEGSLPAVEGMTAGGAATVELSGRISTGSRTVRGLVNLRDVSMETGGGGVSVRRLFLELPLSLRWEAAPDGRLRQVPTAPVEGRLAFGRLTFGDVVFRETSSALVVEADSVALREELAMPFLEGLLVLERPALIDALRTTRVMESGVRISEVSLGALTEALDIVPLEGTVEGNFPRVRLSGTALRVEGDGEFSLLGGRLVVRDISGEEVLSRFPKIFFSAEFREIDLKQVTHTFDFGEMNGILEGWIRDCELFRWVPVRFRARLETVERKGVSQSLNVKAINNIAILGTGGRVGVFDRGIHKFLDRYNYSKLGVEMALARDSFVLRGLERRGERELFLKGRLPFRIDVVNAQPGKTVSFRTMLDRLSTLDFSTSTTAPP